MKRLFVLLIFLIPMSCARKVEVKTPAIVRGERYTYLKDDSGRLYIITSNSRDFNDAIRKIDPGPSSVDKLDLWVITPLDGKLDEKRKLRH